MWRKSRGQPKTSSRFGWTSTAGQNGSGYSTRKNLYELWKIGGQGKTLDFNGFRRIVHEVTSANAYNAAELEAAFVSLAYGVGGAMSFEVFEKAFKSEVPTGVEFETVVIRKVRDWMYRNRLSSEACFDGFCRSAGNFIEKSLTRA